MEKKPIKKQTKKKPIKKKPIKKKLTKKKPIKKKPTKKKPTKKKPKKKPSTTSIQISKDTISEINKVLKNIYTKEEISEKLDGTVFETRMLPEITLLEKSLKKYSKVQKIQKEIQESLNWHRFFLAKSIKYKFE